MKNTNPLGLFDDQYLLEKLTKLKDPLVKLNEYIDWNIFRPILNVVFNKSQNSSNTGRPPFDRVLVFKILVLQSLYSLADDAVEYQINDRLSFKRFLGLNSSDRVLDSKTIWLFRETLIREEIIEALFYRFNETLDKQQVFAKTGQIIDGSFVEVPRQRNDRDENDQIKKGQTPEAWKAQPNKLRQIDRDARWTKKNKMNFYGFKNHIKADAGSKLISTYAVTNAAVHDSQALETLIKLDDRDQKLYGDSAYIGQDESIEWCGMRSEIHEKGTVKNKLTEDQKALNRKKSKIRAKVEHIFGFMTNTMKAMYVRTIGLSRAAAKIGLANLTYNMMRCVQLGRKINAVIG